HHFQIVDARRALLQERVENHHNLEAETRAWRSRVAELQNNLFVLQYLQQHPDTPQTGLPGVLVWRTSSFGVDSAVWEAAHESGVIALMPFAEIERNSELYKALQLEAQAGLEATFAARDAERYDLADPDPSHLSSQQLAQEIDLLQIALNKQF